MACPTQILILMQALILAAGLGRRLGEFTAENTKCMLPVNGIRLIDRMLGQLERLPAPTYSDRRGLCPRESLPPHQGAPSRQEHSFRREPHL